MKLLNSHQLINTLSLICEGYVGYFNSIAVSVSHCVC